MMKKIKHFIEFLVLRFIAFKISFLPRPLLKYFASFLATIVHIIGFRKNVVKKNWFHVYENEITPPLLKKIYFHTAYTFIETLWLYSRNKNEVLSLVEKENFDENSSIANFQNENPVFITAHISNWELTGLYLASKYNGFYPAYKKASNPYSEKFLFSVREKFGMFPVLSKLIIKKMAREPDKTYAFLIDQYLGQGIFVNFLNKSSLITDVPVKMAVKLKKPIYFGAGIRDNNFKYIVRYKKLTYNEYMNKTVKEIVEEINVFLSDIIFESPHLWFGWFHKFWKKTSENSKGGIYV